MYCIYIKKKRNKNATFIYCNRHDKKITFDDCKSCLDKQYKARTKIKPPKPKKDTRYSIITTNMEQCIECGKKPIQKHEIFYGSGKRQNSIEYGLVIPLCKKEHHYGNMIGIHKDKELDTKWKIIGQKTYMNYYNKTIDEFREAFGKNYLKENEDD